MGTKTTARELTAEELQALRGGDLKLNRADAATPEPDPASLVAVNVPEQPKLKIEAVREVDVTVYKESVVVSLNGRVYTFGVEASRAFALSIRQAANRIERFHKVPSKGK